MSKPTNLPSIGVLGDAVLGNIFRKRRWAALSYPEEEITSINRAVISIKERMQVQSREAGSLKDSFVTVSDLIRIGVIDASGKTLASRVADIEKRLEDAGIP